MRNHLTYGSWLYLGLGENKLCPVILEVLDPSMKSSETHTLRAFFELQNDRSSLDIQISRFIIMPDQLSL